MSPRRRRVTHKHVTSRLRQVSPHYRRPPPCKPQSCTRYGFLTGGSDAGLLFSDFSGVTAAVVLATSASISDTCSSTSAAVHANSTHSSAATSEAADGSMPRMADSIHDAAITDGFFSMKSGSAETKNKTRRLTMIQYMCIILCS